MTLAEEEDLRVLYQVTVGDLSYFKSQQWNVAYYALLIEAGLVSVAQLLGSGLKVFDRALLASLAVIAATSALYVIGKLQKSILVRDARLDAVRRSMTGAFQKAWAAEPKAETKVQNVFLLRGGIVATTLLTIWLVSFRLGAV